MSRRVFVISYSLHCGQRYVSLPEVEHQITNFLETISLPNRFYGWAIARLEKLVAGEQQKHVDRRISLKRDHAAVTRELENLTKLRIRDLLSDEEYVQQRQELERRQIGITQQLQVQESNDAWFEPAKALISLNNAMVSRFGLSNLQAKRLILAITGSNLILKDQELNIHARKPFRRWSESPNFSEVLAFVRDIRTFLIAHSKEAIEMIAAIRQLSDESHNENSVRLN